MYVYASGEKGQKIIKLTPQNSSKYPVLLAALINSTHSQIILFVQKIKHMQTKELIMRTQIIIVTTSFPLIHLGLTGTLYISIYLQKD